MDPKLSAGKPDYVQVHAELTDRLRKLFTCVIIIIIIIIIIIPITTIIIIIIIIIIF
jgi:hypothetical protein